MWEYVPSLYHTQRDEHHHLTADEWLVDKVKGYCTTTYGGDLAAMLHTFENKEVVEKLSGSHNMRRILLPTVRMDVPESQKKDPVYAHGYSTTRRIHEMTMTNAFNTTTTSSSASNEISSQPKNPFVFAQKNSSSSSSSGLSKNVKEYSSQEVPSFKAGGPFAPKPLVT
jgi:hypothetical protein